MANQEAPERLFWVKSPFGASAHDVSVYPEDVPYVRADLLDARLKRARADVDRCGIEKARMHDTYESCIAQLKRELAEARNPAPANTRDRDDSLDGQAD